MGDTIDDPALVRESEMYVKMHKKITSSCPTCFIFLTVSSDAVAFLMLPDDTSAFLGIEPGHEFLRK